VNESDFYSLEPLSNIPHEQFFSFEDEKQFVYGFDIFSLMTLMKKTERLCNPYNRENFPYQSFTDLIRLYKIIHILFPTACIRNKYTNVSMPTVRPSPPLERPGNENRLMEVIPVYERETDRITSVNNTLSEIRNQSMDTRIRELFMEINLLGNYAESRWFLDLERLRLARFYQFYYDWWNVRSHLSETMKHNICIVGDPFSQVNLLYTYPTTTMEEFRELCLHMMECMIYGGIDLEHRKLGALQLLSILTVVSMPARNAMPWLYESIFM
jgi:hypothetical protein